MVKLNYWKEHKINTKKPIRNVSFILTLNVQQNRYYTTNNIHLKYASPAGSQQYQRPKVLRFNISFISGKDEGDFQTTTEGLIKEKARLESGNEGEP